MTDNIQKLYKVAGVEKIGLDCKQLMQYKYCFENECRDPFFKPYPRCVGYENCNKEYKESGKEYPPFTAEKQLELIKWLATKQEKFTILYDSDYGYTCEVVNINNCYESFCYYDPIQALCNLTIGLWNDLSDEQREEVKRILQ